MRRSGTLLLLALALHVHAGGDRWPVGARFAGMGNAGLTLVDLWSVSANQAGLASPNLLQWTQSGTLLVMVIVGGVGALYGGAVGAVALLLVEEVLAHYTTHWHAALGLILLLVVFRAPKGIAAWAHGLFARGEKHE